MRDKSFSQRQLNKIKRYEKKFGFAVLEETKNDILVKNPEVFNLTDGINNFPLPYKPKIKENWWIKLGKFLRFI